MSELRTAHTADLDAETLRAAHALLVAAFAENWWTDHDWEHALGGVHALVWEGDELIAHASVVQRRMLHGGRALRTGYVEGVAVRADRRRLGHGAALMDALARVVHGAYDLGALAATEDGAALYTARGWQQWQGPTSTPRHSSWRARSSRRRSRATGTSTTGSTASAASTPSCGTATS